MVHLGDIKGIPPIAGKTEDKGRDTAKGCLTLNDRQSTPPHVRKWRKSFYSEPGQRVLHPGQIEDATKLAMDRNRVYGVSSKGSEHLEAVSWISKGRATGNPSDAPEMRQAMNEALYLSTKREPLGKPVIRGHVLPETVTQPSFRFGVSSSSSVSVKELLYPHKETDDNAFRSQYIKSHHSYEPGEQKRRAYTWSIDPTKYRFGTRGGNIPYNGISSGVASILHGEPDLDPRRIASISQVNYQTTQDRLGNIRAVGNRRSDLSPDHVFGRPTVRRSRNDWDAKACLQGGYTLDEQQPDPDLGKSITPGFRNVVAETRTFGVPSIRTDIPKYDRRSLADSQNYGDDVNASALLHPSQFANQGVEDEEFLKPRDKNELQDIFKKVGYDLSNEEFDLLYTRTTGGSREGNNPKCSIQSFRKTLNEFLTSKEYDTLDQWMDQATITTTTEPSSSSRLSNLRE